MYSFSYLEPVCCSMSSFNRCFLTCIQVSQEAGQVLSYAHLFQNFPQFIVIHTVKGFDIVNKAEIDVYVKLSCFFNDQADVGSLISGSSAFSKSSLYIWKFTIHWTSLLKPGLENFEHYFTCMWDECNHAVVWEAQREPIKWYVCMGENKVCTEFGRKQGMYRELLSTVLGIHWGTWNGTPSDKGGTIVTQIFVIMSLS